MTDFIPLPGAPNAPQLDLAPFTLDQVPIGSSIICRVNANGVDAGGNATNITIDTAPVLVTDSFVPANPVIQNLTLTDLVVGDPVTATATISYEGGNLAQMIEDGWSVEWNWSSQQSSDEFNFVVTLEKTEEIYDYMNDKIPNAGAGDKFIDKTITWTIGSNSPIQSGYFLDGSPWVVDNGDIHLISTTPESRQVKLGRVTENGDGTYSFDDSSPHTRMYDFDCTVINPDFGIRRRTTVGRNGQFSLMSSFGSEHYEPNTEITSNGKFCFDGRAGYNYDSSLWVLLSSPAPGDYYVDHKWDKTTRKLEAGDTVYTARSVYVPIEGTNGDPDNPNPLPAVGEHRDGNLYYWGHVWFPTGDQDQNIVEQICILNILSSAPPANAFRPPANWDPVDKINKPIFTEQDDLSSSFFGTDTNPYPNFTCFDNTTPSYLNDPNWTTENIGNNQPSKSGIFITTFTTSNQQRQHRPLSENWRGYGGFESIILQNQIVKCFDAKLNPELRTRLRRKIAQKGIDAYGMWRSTCLFNHYTGFHGGQYTPCFLMAWLVCGKPDEMWKILNAEEIGSEANDTLVRASEWDLSARDFPENIFHESSQRVQSTPEFNMSNMDWVYDSCDLIESNAGETTVFRTTSANSYNLEYTSNPDGWTITPPSGVLKNFKINSISGICGDVLPRQIVLSFNSAEDAQYCYDRMANISFGVKNGTTTLVGEKYFHRILGGDVRAGSVIQGSEIIFSENVDVDSKGGSTDMQLIFKATMEDTSTNINGRFSWPSPSLDLPSSHVSPEQIFTYDQIIEIERIPSPSEPRIAAANPGKNLHTIRNISSVFPGWPIGDNKYNIVPNWYAGALVKGENGVGRVLASSALEPKDGHFYNIREMDLSEAQAGFPVQKIRLYVKGFPCSDTNQPISIYRDSIEEAESGISWMTSTTGGLLATPGRAIGRDYHYSTISFQHAAGLYSRHVGGRNNLPKIGQIMFDHSKAMVADPINYMTLTEDVIYAKGLPLPNGLPPTPTNYQEYYDYENPGQVDPFQDSFMSVLDRQLYTDDVAVPLPRPIIFGRKETWPDEDLNSFTFPNRDVGIDYDTDMHLLFVPNYNNNNSSKFYDKDGTLIYNAGWCQVINCLPNFGQTDPDQDQDDRLEDPIVAPDGTTIYQWLQIRVTSNVPVFVDDSIGPVGANGYPQWGNFIGNDKTLYFWEKGKNAPVKFKCEPIADDSTGWHAKYIKVDNSGNYLPYIADPTTTKGTNELSTGGTWFFLNREI